jgi:hypothetical protein
MGFKSRDCRDGHCKMLILWSSNNFFVDVDVCGGLLSCWKPHLRPSFSLMVEAIRLLAKMPCYWVKLMMLLTLTRTPGPVEAK